MTLLIAVGGMLLMTAAALGLALAFGVQMPAKAVVPGRRAVRPGCPGTHGS